MSLNLELMQELHYLWHPILLPLDAYAALVCDDDDSVVSQSKGDNKTITEIEEKLKNKNKNDTDGILFKSLNSFESF